MTTEKKFSYTDPETRPRPTNYKAEAGFNADSWQGNESGTLTCTTCNAVIRNDLCPADLADPARCLEHSISKHNRDNHPELLWVYTSHGWLPVASLKINDILGGLHK